MTRRPHRSPLFPHPPPSRSALEDGRGGRGPRRPPERGRGERPPGRDHRRGRGRPPRRDAPDRPRRDVRAEGVEVAVGHVHDPHDAVDEAQAARDEEEDRRVEQRVEEVDDEDVHYSATRNGITLTSGFTRLPLRASATSTRYAPGASFPLRSTINRPPSRSSELPAASTSPPAPTTA